MIVAILAIRFKKKPGVKFSTSQKVGPAGRYLDGTYTDNPKLTCFRQQ